MSGDNINFKFEHHSMPLIGALHRYPYESNANGRKEAA